MNAPPRILNSGQPAPPNAGGGAGNQGEANNIWPDPPQAG